MCTDSQQELFIYYNERSLEFDQVYSGKGPAIPHQQLYKKDSNKISNIISSFGKGHIIDIGCGTGYWLPFYANNCREITLVDASERMISECKRRSDKNGFSDKCHYVKGDFFDLDFQDHLFDSVVVGFFLSHLTKEMTNIFLKKVKQITAPNTQIFIIDALWNKLRQQYRKKESSQERFLNDGRKFLIYKKYFTKTDIHNMLKKSSLQLISFFRGNVFFAATAQIGI